MTNVIDLSSNNPPPYDLKAAKANGISGVIVKLTEGNGYVNPDFIPAWNAAIANDMVKGMYHFARPEHDSAYAEAMWFLHCRHPLHVGDIIALDMETYYNARYLTEWAKTWGEIVSKSVGFKLLLYGSLSYIESYLNDASLQEYFNLWVADYGPTTCPKTVGIWTPQLWQYTDKGVVSGLQGFVDVSTTALDINGLKALGKRVV